MRMSSPGSTRQSTASPPLCATAGSRAATTFRLPAATRQAMLSSRLLLDVLVPQDRQPDVLALQLAVDPRPIRLGLATVPLLGADGGEQPGFQRGVGQRGRQRPAQTGGGSTLQRQPHRRRGNPDPPCNLVTGNPRPLQTNDLAHLPLSRPSLLAFSPSCAKATEADPKQASRGTPQPGDIIPDCRARSSRNAGRNQIVAAGRNHSGTVGDIARNPQSA